MLAPPVALTPRQTPSSRLEPPTVAEALARLGALPFGPGDTTAGAESELQAAVVGPRERVDLARTIEDSAFFVEVERRAAAGEGSFRVRERIEEHLAANTSQVWENSWVRFPEARLGAAARRLLARDLRSDRRDPASPERTDVARFRCEEAGEDLVRVPIPYLLQLALTDATDGAPEPLAATAARLRDHFLSDNTSPETLSFHVVPLVRSRGNGRLLAQEAAFRHLFTELLADYASAAFGLAERGERPILYDSPLPPLFQRRLNRLISDSFYRELYVSPCLSGWDRGEDKRDYMALCHQVLSRSRLAALGRLRDAGLLRSDLAVLPHTSNTSLANNGTHVSLGSQHLSALVADPESGFGASHEKRLADLATKIVEHFLPLFVGTYSAAPARIDFEQFLPEEMLGYLPHELVPTHLRMLWRRWAKKAGNRALGRTLTATGIRALDRPLARVLGLKGDFVPDFRLLDYPVAWLSTPRAPSLDGRLGNTDRLRRELDDLGIVDARMACYLPFRPRAFAQSGFAGFEARLYSLFPASEDLARAVDLQHLLVAAAYRWIASGRVTAEDLPDTPFHESERRQVLFAAATGVPTFYVRAGTENRFLAGLLAGTQRLRDSRRYPGFVRVRLAEFRLALLERLRSEAQDVAHELGVTESLFDLGRRLREPERRAEHQLTAGILDRLGARHPLALPANEFNTAAEAHYREQIQEGRRSEGREVLLARLRGAGRADQAEAAELLFDQPAEGPAEVSRLRALIHLALGAEAAAAREAVHP